ncbi:type 1 glutamine amidotransferase domain-containing protein [Ectothiorhodospiraceae bacterium 2226]|nr:type 1 glutamine amidotransferase domain-containing protein [Ectothiorhodospiraceae bacterium 2226]
MSEPKSLLMVVTTHDRIDDSHPTGLWFEEFAAPYRLFRERGYRVTVASPRGGAAPIDPKSAPEDPDAPEARAALDALRDTRPLAELDPAAYDAVFFPGGHGTMYDLPNPTVGRVVAQFAAADKVVASVCHGPAALVDATLPDGTPLVRGRKITAFTDAEERAVELDQRMPFLLETRLRELGARFEPAPDWAEHVVVDGKLITGQNPQSSAAAAKAVIELLDQ